MTPPFLQFKQGSTKTHGKCSEEERSHGWNSTFSLLPMCAVLRWAYLGSQDISCDRGDADAAETTGQSNELEQHSSRLVPLTEDQEKHYRHTRLSLRLNIEKDEEDKKKTEQKTRAKLYSMEIFFSRQTWQQTFLRPCTNLSLDGTTCSESNNN